MRKFLRVVPVANGRQLLDHDGRKGQSFWVSRAPRLAVRPGGGRAADGHTLSFHPLADHCPQFIDEIDKQGSEVLIPSKVTQQVVLAGRGQRASQAPVLTCAVPHPWMLPSARRGFPPFARRLWGWNGGFQPRNATKSAARSSTPGPGQGAPSCAAQPQLPAA